MYSHFINSVLIDGLIHAQVSSNYNTMIYQGGGKSNNCFMMYIQIREAKNSTNGIDEKLLYNNYNETLNLIQA